MSESLSRRRAILVAAGSLAAVGVVAAPAQAATVGLSGGSTTVKVDAETGKALTSLGVKLAPVRGAKATSAGVRFPITGGSIDPATAAGVIRHRGGLRLSAGKVRVTLSDFVVTVSKRPKLSAKVNNGKRITALVPVLGKARISRNGLGTTVRNVDLHLSSQAAAVLNKAFHVKAFKSRLKLGRATIVAKPADVAFAGGQTDLALDAGAGAALASLGVTAGLVAPATANADGSFAFPITGGLVSLKTLGGEITHSGGISLTKGATVVSLTDFTVDTKAKQLTAVINGGARAAILDLDLSAPKVAVAGRTVTVGGVGATLTQGAADALNGAFGVTAFTAGLKLGVATVRGDGA